MPNIVLIQNDYSTFSNLLTVLNYIQRSAIIGGYAIDPVDAYRQFIMVKNFYHKTDGVQLIHFIVSFSARESFRVGVDEMLQLGFQIGQVLDQYQMAYAVHLDSQHMHLHLVMNSVSFVDGRKYHEGRLGLYLTKSLLSEVYPWSSVRLYQSYPRSDCNQFSYTSEDELLRIG